MVRAPLDAACGLRRSVEDAAFSSRLASCFTCCIESNCSQFCEGFVSSECLIARTRCAQGSILEFRASSHFREAAFACHVEPMKDQVLYKLAFQVYFNGREVGKNLTAIQYLDGAIIERGSILNSLIKHRFFHINYNSHLSEVSYMHKFN